MKYADTTNCTRGWGKVPMYHPSFMSANERAASLSFDQSEDEKLVHDPSDEFLTVTIQGDNSDLEHLYQDSFILNSSQQASSEKSMDSCVAMLQISGLR